MIIKAFRPSDMSLYDKPQDAVHAGDRGKAPYNQSAETAEFLRELSRYCEMFGRAAALRDYEEECRAIGSSPATTLRRAMKQFPTATGLRRERRASGAIRFDSGEVFHVDGPACEHCGGPIRGSVCSRCGAEIQ